MGNRLNVLVVHNVPDLECARRSTLDHIYAFERYAPENNYHYHRMFLPVPPSMRAVTWDAVLFESTSLGVVSIRPRSRVRRILHQWDFLRRSSAVKIAFPQDDASHGAVLDLFFSWLGMDAVFTVRPEHKELIYPISSRHPQFLPTMSGYIDDRDLDKMAASARPFALRQWEVGQRVTFYPAWGGRLARVKGLAALAMKKECSRRGLRESISVSSTDVLTGDDWLMFLGDCRFIVGTEGGLSIWDPYGVIQDTVNAYVERHPEATFEEIEDACFPGLDGLHVFPGTGPRILEAAMMGCGQVLVEGEYRGLLAPWRHYIPLRADFSNFDDVFSAMANRDRVGDMIDATRRDLVLSPRFRYSSLVARVLELIYQLRPRGGSDSLSADEFAYRIQPFGRELVEECRAVFSHEEGLEGDSLEVFVEQLLPRGEVRDTDGSSMDGVAAEGQSGSPVRTGEDVPMAVAADREGSYFSHLRNHLASIPWGAMGRSAILGGLAAIAALAYPLGVRTLAAPTLQLPPPDDAAFSWTFFLAQLVALVALPAGLRPLRVDGVRAAATAAFTWAVAGQALWVAMMHVTGDVRHLDRWSVAFTAGLQAMSAFVVLLMAVSRRAAIMPAATILACLPLFLLAGTMVLSLPFALFATVNVLVFHLLIVRKGLGPRRPLRFLVAVARWIVVTHLLWLLALFLTGILTGLPRLLPLWTTLLQGAVAVGILALWLRLENGPRDDVLKGDPALELLVERGPVVGGRTAWIISYTGVSNEPRVLRQARALIDDGWRVVVCGFDGHSPRPRDWTYVRLPGRASYSDSVLLRLRVSRELGRIVTRWGRPTRLSRWGARLYQVSIPHWRHIRLSLLALVEREADLAPDLVIANDYYTCDVAHAVAERCGARFAVDCHEYAAEQYSFNPHWVRWERPYVVGLQDYYLPRADHVTTVCEGIAELLNRDYQLRRPVLVVRSVPMKQPQPFRPVGERIRVLYHGGIWHVRGLHTAVESLRLWRSEFELVLRGDGDVSYIAELRRIAARHGVEMRLSIEPALPFDDIVPAANRADIGYFSYRSFSRQSQFVLPNKFFEYVMAGLALCVADLPEMSRLVRRYGMGKLIPDQTPEAIAKTINSFTREEIERCKRASLLAAGELNWDHEREAVIGAYNALFEPSLAAVSPISPARPRG